MFFYWSEVYIQKKDYYLWINVQQLFHPESITALQQCPSIVSTVWKHNASQTRLRV